MPRLRPSGPSAPPPVAPDPPQDPRLADAEALYRAGRTTEALTFLQDSDRWPVDDRTALRLLVLRGMSFFDTGNVVTSIDLLRQAMERARPLPADVQFSVAFALFVREADFQTPTEVLPGLARLRQIAARAGDARSIAGLNLAVARLEACRGRCLVAKHHIHVAHRLAGQLADLALSCAVDLVDASRETVAGNMNRSRRLAERCLHNANRLGFSKYQSGATSNLAQCAIVEGDTDSAQKYLSYVLAKENVATFVLLPAVDNVSQLCLLRGDLKGCWSALTRFEAMAAAIDCPARSWNALENDLTRVSYFERLEDWQAMLAVVEAADSEVARRRFRAIRASLLCARARAAARLGQHALAETALVTAMRTCPRGAVDPLIVLEATRALCRSLRGDQSLGALHYDRALAACRAIGHRYHEQWIDRHRRDLARTLRESVSVPRERDLTDTALLVNDVATMVGAGHSIDLLAHRLAGILRSTPLAPRIQVDSQSGQPYAPDPSCLWEAGADGTCTLTLSGSDRRVTIRVRDVASLDEISLLKSLADLVQAAVNRTADTEAEDDEQNLWPRGFVPNDDDTVFQSPRMAELLRVAARLASTDLPVLITGETGTGKEILARLIHDQSRVRQGPFVAFNCSAIPRDLVESQLFGHRRGAFTGAMDSFPGVIRAAERGTLFLDEIGDLDPGTQPKFLRFLESGEVHPVGEPRSQRVAVRVVAATNADLADLVRQGRFRADLFYRIGGTQIALPPLRERKDEIPALAAVFLSRFARECGRSGVRLADELIAALLLYDWPGNIRQLANEIRRMVAVAADGDTLGIEALAPEIARAWHSRAAVDVPPDGPVMRVRLDQTLDAAIAAVEEQFVRNALDITDGRVAEAARLLGLSRKGLFLKRRRYRLAGD